MTGSAVRTILSIMLVILLVAGIAIGGRAFVLLVDMTGLASHLRMSALQPEGRKVVIECCRLPAVGGVTLTAISAKAALVSVVIEVTGIAVLEGHREITESARVDMALHTCHAHMLARDLERKSIMIEILSETIHAIMTVETRRTKRQCVGGHESQIRLTVTAITGIGSKCRYILLMAIGTGERLTRSGKLMCFQ